MPIFRISLEVWELNRQIACLDPDDAALARRAGFNN